MNYEDSYARRVMAGVDGLLSEPAGKSAECRGEGGPRVFNLDSVCVAEARSSSIDMEPLLRGCPGESAVTITSSRKHFRWLAVAAKRAVWKLTGWYMNPLVQDVRTFNVLVARTLADVGSSIDESKARLDELERAEAELRGRIAEDD
jgi:hypothetical protein